MSLEKQSAGVGDFLFRWRSYMPLVFIAVMMPALLKFTYPMGSEAYDLVWEMFCLVVSLFGLGIRCYTVGYTPKNTSGRNTKRQIADTLNTTGIYSITRNPLYLGNFFMMLGVTMFVRCWWVTLIYALAFWLYYERIIFAEEQYLKRKFGDKYQQYLNEVPAFLPRFHLWQSNILTFSLRNVLKREYSGLFAAVSAFASLEIASDYVVENKLILDPVWVAIFGFALFLYLVLRTLKKRTNVLDVDGR